MVDKKDKIIDFGHKIGGARKDMWRKNGLSLEDIADWTDAEKRMYVNKECIWPFRPKELVASGINRVIVFWQRKMRTLAYAEPRLSRQDFSEGINNYLSQMIDYKNSIMSVKTMEDRDRFYEEFNVYYQKNRYNFSKWVAAVSPYDISRSRYKKREWDYKCQTSNFPEPESRSKKTQRKGKFIPPQLLKIEREGKDYRKGFNVNPEYWQKTFNFWGCEFGNWTNQNDRQYSLNYAFDALKDLANVLNIDDESIAFNNKLSLAFGSRGVANSAAHYEPARRVINLTKFKGAGNTAHEWFHALDHTIALECGITDSDFASESKQTDKLPKSFIKLCKAIREDEMGNKTDFLICSEEFDMCFSKSDHGYWSSTVEMLARAFACYVKDMLGCKSDYLIALADVYEFKYDNESKCAHPQGEEREFFDELFDDLFVELIKMGILKKRESLIKSMIEEEYDDIIVDITSNQIKLFA